MASLEPCAVGGELWRLYLLPHPLLTCKAVVDTLQYVVGHLWASCYRGRGLVMACFWPGLAKSIHTKSFSYTVRSSLHQQFSKTLFMFVHGCGNTGELVKSLPVISLSWQTPPSLLWSVSALLMCPKHPYQTKSLHAILFGSRLRPYEARELWRHSHSTIYVRTPRLLMYSSTGHLYVWYTRLSINSRIRNRLVIKPDWDSEENNSTRHLQGLVVK